jgi:hypothetical protein
MLPWSARRRVMKMGEDGCFSTRLNFASNRLSDGTRASNIVASAQTKEVWAGPLAEQESVATRCRPGRERSRRAQRAGAIENYAESEAGGGSGAFEI